MNPFKRYMVWLRRMSHSRGFGVQSPSAYRFIRYVLCEHYPYYAYGELRRRHPSVTWLVRKRMELYFRIANYRQADVWIDNGTADSALLGEYVSRGCRRTRIAADAAGGVVQIARVCPRRGCSGFLDSVLARAGSDTVVIVEDIMDDPVARAMWQRLTGSEMVSVSYDLYWVGVAFFDTGRFKTNYIVNF